MAFTTNLIDVGNVRCNDKVEIHYKYNGSGTIAFKQANSKVLDITVSCWCNSASYDSVLNVCKIIYTVKEVPQQVLNKGQRFIPFYYSFTIGFMEKNSTTNVLEKKYYVLQFKGTAYAKGSVMPDGSIKTTI